MSAGNSLLLSRRDLDFLLYEWLDAEALTRAPRYAEHSRATFDAVLDTCERIAVDRFAPHYQKSDRDEPQFDGHGARVIPEVGEALRAMAESGLFAAGQDEADGGMQLPVLIEKAGMAYLTAANVSTAGYPFLTIANANLLRAHASAAQIDAFARPQWQGRYFGTMCLSETQAGSSLADVATQAVYEGDSPFGAQYRVTGSKMWISGGEHELSENIVHLVLARIADEQGRTRPGVKGLSLLIVPKFLVNPDGTRGERNDVVLAGLNHKMGYRGITNCFLKFGEGTRHRPQGREGAIGYLVGEPHRGMALMFHMMNEARVGVGLGAAVLGYTGYLHALDYARTRRQGRSGKDPTAAPQPIVEHADVRRMLLAQKAYVEGGLALNLYCARLLDEQRLADAPEVRHQLDLLLEILTPVAKSWPSQWCLAANDLAIQVHGGYGYTREYKVEQFYRDNRLNPIHEGTHGIQALDLLGRKVVMEQGAAFAALMARMRATIEAAAAAGDDRLAGYAAKLDRARTRLADVTRTLHAGGDLEDTLANASLYLEAFGHVVVAWIWLEQARVAQGHHEPFYRGKQMAAQYFFGWELPRVEAQFDLLASRDASPRQMRDEWF